MGSADEYQNYDRCCVSVYHDEAIYKNQNERMNILIDTLNTLGKRLVPSLSEITDIQIYAKKIFELGNVLYLTNSIKIFGMAAFYANSMDTKTAYLTFIAISEEFSGKGYGALLLKEVEEFSYRLGMEQIKLEVQNSNKNARNFYDKMGFEELESASKHTLYLVKTLNGKRMEEIN